MGRMLGAFDNPQELDRPDLNKCPDCLCFFAGDNCPLCGKVCPEEMRAGNRKPPKKEKRRRSSQNGRVTFVEWYHSWWFIVLAMLFFPVVGIILLITSPHKKSMKITVVVIGVAYLLLSSIGIGSILGAVDSWINPPVDTSLSREEYVSRCQTVTPEEFYRSVDQYTDKFVSLTLKVTGIAKDSEAFYSNEKYYEYLICESPDSGQFQILVRNCVQDTSRNFVVGDVITVYGEGAGNVTIQDLTDADYVDLKIYSGPSVNVAYVTLVAPPAN